jgi:hypothetical protein
MGIRCSLGDQSRGKEVCVGIRVGTESQEIELLSRSPLTHVADGRGLVGFRFRLEEPGNSAGGDNPDNGTTIRSSIREKP